jgi:small nuclear ribonucleoprotein (snRNP)-like protein
MAIPLTKLREYENKRVKMRFDDGYEYVATLLSATQDMDGSLHLVYEKVEWINDPSILENLKNKALYSEGEALASIEEVPSGVQV